jgi:hypothetical protein
MLINRTDADWMNTSFGGHVGSATGWDFVVTGGDGVTKLDHEIESYRRGEPGLGEVGGGVFLGEQEEGMRPAFLRA